MEIFKYSSLLVILRYIESNGNNINKLIQLIYLIFFGLIGVTIIAVHLIITLIILSNKKPTLCYGKPCGIYYKYIW